MELIQLNKQDVIFAGGGEAEHWSLTNMFDAMGALSTKYNDTPDKASRAFDQDRDGFVIAGGAGVLVLEEQPRLLECALFAGGVHVHQHVGDRQDGGKTVHFEASARSAAWEAGRGMGRLQNDEL